MTSTATADARAPEALLDAAVAAARAAADHLRGIDRTDIDRTDKTSAHDIVTEHDTRCERIVLEVLRERVPGCRVLGEEGGVHESVDPACTVDAPVTFIVDPIDGTSNFAAGLPLFCVSIGAEVDGRLVAGVIDAPILGQVFTAGPDGARLNGEALGPHRTRAARDALVLSSYPTPRGLDEMPDIATGALRDDLDRIGAVRSLGSAALELAWVAAGWADAAMLTGIHPWDVAAGFLLVERAGGSLRTWPGAGDPQAPAHHHPAYVACRGAERLEVLDALHDRIQDRRTASV